MHQIHFRLGLLSDPAGGAYSPPDHLAEFREPTYKGGGREGKEGGGEVTGGDGMEREVRKRGEKGKKSKRWERKKMRMESGEGKEWVLVPHICCVVAPLPKVARPGNFLSNFTTKKRESTFSPVLYSFRAAYRKVVCSVALSRYISVCHPFRREKFCTTRRACIVIGCLSGGVLALHVIQAYFWQFSGIKPEN